MNPVFQICADIHQAKENNYRSQTRDHLIWEKIPKSNKNNYIEVLPFSFKKSFFRQRHLISTFLFNFKTKLRHEQFKSTWDKMCSQEEKQNSSNCFTNPSFAYSPATQLFWNSTWWIFGSVKSKLAFLLLTVIVV